MIKGPFLKGARAALKPFSTLESWWFRTNTWSLNFVPLGYFFRGFFWCLRIKVFGLVLSLSLDLGVSGVAREGRWFRQGALTRSFKIFSEENLTGGEPCCGILPITRYLPITIPKINSWKNAGVSNVFECVQDARQFLWRIYRESIQAAEVNTKSGFTVFTCYDNHWGAIGRVGWFDYSVR